MFSMYMGCIIKKDLQLYVIRTRNGKLLGSASSIERARNIVHEYILYCYECGYEVPEAYMNALKKMGEANHV